MVLVQRVSVVGNSGSGKSTFARRLAARGGVPYVELDAIFHQPEWAELELDEFRRLVAAQVAERGWVIEGNYAAVQDLVWARANTVVWLDFGRAIVMWRVVTRTVGRVLTRRDLWNGNREPWSNLFSTDPQRSIIAWSWKEHARYRVRYRSASEDPTLVHLRFVRLGSPRAARRFLADRGEGDWTGVGK